MVQKDINVTMVSWVCTAQFTYDTVCYEDKEKKAKHCIEMLRNPLLGNFNLYLTQGNGLAPLFYIFCRSGSTFSALSSWF
jgi:hypothetical protein